MSKTEQEASQTVSQGEEGGTSRHQGSAPVAREAGPLPAALDRRSFVKGGAASVAAMALGTTALASLAGCGPKQEKAPDAEKPAPQVEAYDIVIVGAGGAGLAAALAAKQGGVAKVLLLEKGIGSGGNTNFSSSGMNASETRFQVKDKIEDTNELFAEDTFKGGHELGERTLVDFMCSNSSAAIDWLDEAGITLDNITQMGGASVKRCHRPTDGSAIGKTLIPGLRDAVEREGVETLVETPATELVVDANGAVTGVKAQTKDGAETTFEAKAVIIAAGGFGSNKEMLRKYRPEVADFVTTNIPYTTGDGMIMAQKAGAELVLMEQVQTHPTVEQTTGALIAEGIRGGGAILINSEGKRFFNEMETRDAVSEAELEQPGKYAYVVYDQQVYESNLDAVSYDERGLSVKAPTLAELASKIKVDTAALEEAVATYNAVTTDGATDPFGRTKGLIAFGSGPFYACKIAPGIHYCMGGIRIDEQSRALDAKGKPIAGLYAAGESTGGLHGSNRLGGNGVCDTMVFGPNAAEQAALYIAKSA
ncbi:MAG: flavocytochrome c [Coriobacteriales bacterium]|jgi:fumarate reductase flavoprotein subunit|nr:flavocytochrome c [Coriobacteriales bacterium]